METSVNFQALAQALAERFEAPDAYTAIVRACERLRAEAGQYQPPIRLKAVLRRLGVDYQYAAPSASKEEASLGFSDGRMSIIISRDRFKSSPRRARFSIAHEIGHLILIRTLGQEAFSLGEGDPVAYRAVERLCDFAASHLLMPRDQLAAALRERGVGSFGVRGMTDVFEVSREALFRAIADLVPCGTVMMWRYYQRHPREEVTWRVWGSYAPIRGANDRPWLPKGCTLKHLTIGDRLADLEPDKAIVVRDIEMSLGARVTRHDAVLCQWSVCPSRQQSSMPYSAVVADADDRRNLTVGSDCLIAVLARKDRVDASLFSAREERL